MVTKEHSEYYMLKGKYRFQNVITGREAFLCGYSKPIKRKCRRKELQILREQIIDRSLNLLALYLRIIKSKECKSHYVFVEILNEEWQKL